MESEFGLIGRYFSRPAPADMLGVGDDCALFSVKPGFQLATSTDLLIEGRHFLSDADPQALGHKALAVNLSDLAAMGASPLACLLGISLPVVDHKWLTAFSEGFYDLADKAGCPLVGGDTTRSNTGIVISVTVMGQVRAEQALRRSAAQIGDDVWVTGTLGAPDIALRMLQGRLPVDQVILAAAQPSLERPEPPLAFAAGLAGVANAALDISDGLLQDLGHILRSSHCGAQLQYPAMPVHPGLKGVDPAAIQAAVLAGGDVYQLCFTALPGRREAIQALASQTATQITRIGTIVQGSDAQVFNAQGALIQSGSAGFDHFS